VVVSVAAVVADLLVAAVALAAAVVAARAPVRFSFPSFHSLQGTDSFFFRW